MAAPVCTDAALINDAVCYRRSSINPEQQQALLVYANVLELQAIGGTDYRDELADQLLIDSACPPDTEDLILAAKINIAFLNAATAGATVPATLTAKMAAIACLQNAPGGIIRIKQAGLRVICKLGVHKAYVQ